MELLKVMILVLTIGMILLTIKVYKNTMLMNILPSGVILAWSKESIPDGWAYCDGNNGTPDLRSRFILGAGSGSGLSNRMLNEEGGNENSLVNHRHLLVTRNSTSDASINDASGLYPIIASIDSKPWLADKFKAGVYGEGSSSIRNTTEGRKMGPEGDDKRENSMMFTGEPINITEDSLDANTTDDSMPPYYVLSYIMKL